MRRSPSLPFALVPLLVAAAAAARQAPESTAAAPRIVVAEPVFDAGTVPRGEPVEHVFAIANEGDAPLEIREARPACGCTVAEFDATIAPGATGRVRASLDTTSFRGGIAKSVTVYSNDRTDPALQLTIKANVEPFVDVVPGYVRLVHVQGTDPVVDRQVVWATDGHALDVLGVESPLPYLQAQVRPATSDERSPEGPERQWAIDTVLTADAPIGPLDGTVVIATDHPRQPRVEVPLAGFVRPVLQASPPIVDFGSFPAGEPRKASVLVTNHGPEPLDVTAVDSSVPGLEAQIQRPDGRGPFRILLTLAPGQAPGPLAGTLTVRTSSAAVPELEVELRGQVLAAGR